MHILDVGCGPGTITADLAVLVPDGQVIGMDISPDVLQSATARGLANCTFTLGNAMSIPFPDNTFDITHAHQVLQHLRDPVAALREMRRVTKPGGLVASRETDCEGFIWYPPSQGMTEWRSTYMGLAKQMGAEPNAGRQTHAWAKRAGFRREDIQISTSTTCYSTVEEVAWWGGVWQERTLASSFAGTAKEHAGLGDSDLERIAKAWKDWSVDEDAWFMMPQGEILCTVRK